MSSRNYTIHGMDCTDCALTIEKGVSRLEGVRQVRVDFVTSKMTLDGDTPVATLAERVKALGYSLVEGPTVAPQSAVKPSVGGIIGFWHYLVNSDETRLALAGGAIIVIALVGTLFSLNTTLRDGLFIVAMLIAAYPVARSGLNTLIINRDFNINLLMTIASVGAVIIGEPLEGATVVCLFAIGEALEGYTADRARDSLRGLMELAPQSAIRLSNGQEELVGISTLRINDTILIKPGERIGMDGVVLQGTSAVNQAPITGESIPVYKAAHSDVFAGTINGDGALQVNVTHLAEDNTLSRIIKLVEDAQSERAPTQRLIDQIAHYYTPLVVAVAALIAIVPPLLFN